MSEWLDSIVSIIEATTTPYRKGDVVTERSENGIRVVEIYGYDKAPGAGDEQIIDVHFIDVGVHVAQAKERADELTRALAGYPNPERLGGGPSYIELGAELGSQEYALRLIALGDAIGLWKVITPESLGFKGAEADRMAGSGMVLCTGWKSMEMGEY